MRSGRNLTGLIGTDQKGLDGWRHSQEMATVATGSGAQKGGRENVYELQGYKFDSAGGKNLLLIDIGQNWAFFGCEGQ